jgi:hypothetical protein
MNQRITTMAQPEIRRPLDVLSLTPPGSRQAADDTGARATGPPREPDSLRSCALQHVKLVPQGQGFEVERRARTRQRSESQQERAQH